MIIRSVMVIVGLFMIWQAVVSLFQLPVFLLPGPKQVFEVMVQNPTLLLTQAWPTIVETLIGFLLAAV